CPKCTPASSIRRMETSAMESSFWGWSSTRFCRRPRYRGTPPTVFGACVKLPRRRVASEARALYHSALAANNVDPHLRNGLPSPFKAAHGARKIRRFGGPNSMITIKTPEEQDKMRMAGRLAAQVLDMIGPHVKPGIATEELDRICHDYIVGELQSIPAP